MQNMFFEHVFKHKNIIKTHHLSVCVTRVIASRHSLAGRWSVDIAYVDFVWHYSDATTKFGVI